MRILSIGLPALALAGLIFASATTRADDFPADLTRWKPSPDLVLFRGAGPNDWDQKIRERGWIVPDVSGYRLYYTGYNDAISKDRYLGLATSPDGLRWTRDPANPIHRTSWVEDVCFLRADGVDWLFAEGKLDIAHLLKSTDGKAFEDLGPLEILKADGTPIDPGPRGTPAVFADGKALSLFYERYDAGVWLARPSGKAGDPTGKLSWKNVQDEPVLKAGPEDYDKAAVAVNQVFKRGDTYYAIYHANAERPWKEWTTCIARSKDLIRWEKFAGNPIVRDNRSSGIVVETEAGPRLYTMHPEVRRYEPASAP